MSERVSINQNKGNSGSLFANIPYTTAVPFNVPITLIAGKTLTSNDTFTYVADGAVNGYGAQVQLIGNGVNSPVLTNFHVTGAYVNTLNTINLLIFTYVDGLYNCVIINLI